MTKRIEVPPAMLKAAHEAFWRKEETDSRTSLVASLEAALLWLSENPVVPTDKQAMDVHETVRGVRPVGGVRDSIACYAEWQRRMFIAPEPEVPEEVEDLLADTFTPTIEMPRTQYNADIIEAFNRGIKKAGK